MEAIYYTLLLIIPGALVEVFYRLLAPERYEVKDGGGEHVNLAKYIFNSLWITGLSLAIFYLLQKCKPYNMHTLLTRVGIGWNVVIMICIVVVISFLFALAWKYILDPLQRKQKTGATVTLNYSTVWKTLIHDSERYGLHNCYAVVCKDGEAIRAGIIGAMPGEYSDEKAILLDWSDWVTDHILCGDNEAMKGFLVTEYNDTSSGYSIRFYQSDDLFVYLSKFVNGPEKAAEAGAFSEEGLVK